MKEAVRRQALKGRLAALLLALLALLAACTPGDAAPAATGGAPPALPSGSASDAATSSATSSASSPGTSPVPAAPRPILLEPIVESRPSGADRSLAEEDLRNLGELGILPHVVQSLSSGTTCDFNDAMSSCQ